MLKAAQRMYPKMKVRTTKPVVELTNSPSMTRDEIELVAKNWENFLKCERIATPYNEEKVAIEIVEDNFTLFMACLNGVIQDKVYPALYAKDPSSTEERMIYRAFVYAINDMNVTECLDQEIPGLVKSMRFTINCLNK